jgi:hypothetical protein
MRIENLDQRSSVVWPIHITNGSTNSGIAPKWREISRPHHNWAREPAFPSRTRSFNLIASAISLLILGTLAELGSVDLRTPGRIGTGIEASIRSPSCSRISSVRTA